MCRFLLQNGADVNHFAPFPGTSYCGNVFTFVFATNFSEDKQARNRFPECQALLLDAGCDPTVPWVARDGQSRISFEGNFLFANLVIIVSRPGNPLDRH